MTLMVHWTTLGFVGECSSQIYVTLLAGTSNTYGWIGYCHASFCIHPGFFLCLAPLLGCSWSALDTGFLLLSGFCWLLFWKLCLLSDVFLVASLYLLCLPLLAGITYHGILGVVCSFHLSSLSSDSLSVSLELPSDWWFWFGNFSLCFFSVWFGIWFLYHWEANWMVIAYSYAAVLVWSLCTLV